MNESYAREKTYLAVLDLASRTVPLRERLADAYLDHLALLKIHKIPWPDLRARFDIICADLAPGGNLREALAVWPDDDVSRIAREIVGLFSAISARQSE